MINNKFHINSQYCGYKTTKAVGTKKRLLYTMQWPKAFGQLFCIEIPIYVDVFSCYNEKRSMHVV